MKYYFKEGYGAEYKEVSIDFLQEQINRKNNCYGCCTIDLVKIENNAFYFEYFEFEC